MVKLITGRRSGWTSQAIGQQHTSPLRAGCEARRREIVVIQSPPTRGGTKNLSVLGHFRPTARNSPKDDVTRGGVVLDHDARRRPPPEP